MKSLFSVAVAGCLVAWAAGCQESTTTGPADRPSAPTSSAANQKQKKLTVMSAKDHSVEQGESDKVLVTINRDNFDDPVRIDLNGLPAGVLLVDKNPVIGSDDSSITLTLQASADAPVGEHSVTLVASAPGIEKNTQTFKLKIEAANN